MAIKSKWKPKGDERKATENSYICDVGPMGEVMYSLWHWWEGFVEKVSFESGMKEWMCDGW